MFATKYKSFLINDELEHDVFEFNDLCSTSNCLVTAISESTSESIFPHALELKPLPDYLEYVFLRPDESLPLIIAPDLGWD